MNCKELNIPRKADQEFEIEILDENGVAMDLSTTTQAVIVLYYENGTVLAKYAKSPISGSRTLNTDFEDFGKLRILLDGVDTENAELGRIYYEVRLQFFNPFYDDSKDDKITTGNYLFTLVDSITAPLL